MEPIDDMAEAMLLLLLKQYMVSPLNIDMRDGQAVSFYDWVAGIGSKHLHEILRAEGGVDKYAKEFRRMNGRPD